ncbi:hypothetical protein SLEP1_g14856 [Rubroshorea leprosula]|uniref:Disease resistance protein At4g27190-like leucine-rich repeats domain-containing protein n=1 Tax=Rubroshorea leprosula TaxID=152421 RepID=A0AAV5IRE8_9ROSI|nr:hypothetical protein SLEP1_g14856 [Rubroshorea leprosula]
MALCLAKLQDLKVSNCATMEHVITGDGADEVLPQLNSINLESCSKLTCFYEGSSMLNLPSLKKIKVANCTAMVTFVSGSSKEQDNGSTSDCGGSEERHDILVQPFFSNKLEGFNLEYLKLSGNINIQQIWHNRVPEMSSLVRNLKDCSVEGCGSLKNLLASSMVKSLVNLQGLVVKNCKMMEGVIVTEEGFAEEVTTQKIFFPNLQTLELDDLPKLKRFCSGNYIAFPRIKTIIINQCPLLKAFTSSPVIGDTVVSTEKAENTSTPLLFDAKVALPMLENLAISHIGSLDKIWHNQLDADSFCKLKHLVVPDCETLESIFPFSMLERLQRLEKLWIRRCDSLEVIFEPQGHIASYSRALVASQPTLVETETNLVLPKLTELSLESLPKLKGFCHPIHFKCPSLKKLEVVGFQQLEIFALEFPSFRSTTSDHQLETRQHPLFWINKATFSNLEELKLERIGSLKEIWRGQYAGDYFPKLKKLELIHFSEQSVVPPFFFQSLPCSLEKLVVTYASFHEIFRCEGSGGEGRPAGALTRLRELRLSNLNELMHLWKVKPDLETIVYNLRALEVLECSKLMNLAPSIISLGNLQDLEVSRCHGLVSLMRYSTAKSLVQLTRISISDCDMVGEIVTCVDDEGKDGIVFSQLKYLRLNCLPRLAAFCSVDCNFEFPFLKDIIVMGCPKMQLFSKGNLSTPKLLKVKLTEEDDEGRWEGDLNITLQRLFMEKIGYYWLENLKISEFELLDQAIIEIWNRNPGEILPFRNLKSLEVSNYRSWRYLLTPSMALGLVNLQDLKVSNCATMEHVITGDGADEAFPQLNSINLESCSTLTCFYEGSSTLKLPSLKEITVANCTEMVTFVSGSSKEQDHVSTSDGAGSEERHDISIQPFFSNKLEAFNLESLRLSGNINIQQIWHNRVPEMSSLVRNLIECIVDGCEGFAKEERMQKIFFPDLQLLMLQDLPKLTRFCSGNYIKFPCLTGLVISQCSLLKAFTSSPVIGDIVVSTEKSEKTSKPPLFDAKVAVPVLKTLEINHIQSLHKIWHNQFDAESFCKLELLNVTDCETLQSIFPFSMPARLQRLEKLFIRRCDSLEEIFEHQGHIASYSQALIASQPNLVETETKLVLPKLIELGLQMLPKLKGFCHSKHITECPSLMKLEAVGFQQLEIFALEFPSFQSTTCDHQLETRHHPLFWINKATFSNLEELKLEKIGSLKEIWRGQYAGDYFPKLKKLKLVHVSEQSVVPPFFFQSLPCSLEKLVVSYASFHEIFQCEGSGGEGRPAGALTQLRELRLSNLNELMHLWKVKPDFETIVYNLRVLEVLECSKLMNFVPSIISLKNLQTLNVSRCHGLLNLARYLAAKSLVKLTRMSISDCDMIEEIVACMDDEGKDGIVFSQLKYLQLSHLPRLAAFCSVDCNFKFPSLEDIIVMGCPNMQLFSKGELSTPKLQKVKFIEENDEGRWEGNLNTTLQQMFMEKVGYYGLENLKISESELLDQAILEIWNNRNPREILPFRKLKSLEVSNYSNWRYLSTTSMALGLVSLQDLKVSNCATLEHVIIGDGADGVFPKLNSINLESCSNLKSFYEGSSMLKLPSLKQITVANCAAMVTFAYGSSRKQDIVSTADGGGSGERHDIAIQPFFSNKLEVLNLEILRLFGNINIQQIWHNRVPEMSSFVRNLIEVRGCNNLKYILTSTMVQSLEHLKCLVVSNCKMMEGVIVTEEGFAEEETMQKIFFPNLQALVLDDLPKLKRFCSGNYITFPCLKGIVINQCPLLMAFTCSPVIGDIAVSIEKAENTSTPPLFDAKVAVPVLETLGISSMEGLHKIWHNQLDAESFCKLKCLHVIGCETLEGIFPFGMLERLQRLEQLSIIQCDSLEVIFEPQGPVASYSQSLVASQPTLVETETKLVLPKLTELRLQILPTLKGFCHSKHITECPSLMKLTVVGFQQIEIFALEFPSFQSTTGDEHLETLVQHSLFWINEATFSNLEELKLEKIGNLKEIWRGKYAGDYFPKLKKLELIHFSEQSVIPPFFFQSLPCSLEKLVVSYASFHEIFQCEGALTQLRELRLSNLNELMHLWKVKPDFETIVYNLRALEVLECSKLMNLVPSMISLRNLQDLEVSRCHGLVSLMRYSTAKSLVQLTRMSISDCGMIGEIVACIDDEVKDCIVFSKLKYLRLKGLPKLANFCSVECSFEFPILNDLIVMDCPDMQFFSKGELITPELQKVKLTEEDDEGPWEGDLTPLYNI